MNGNKGRWEEIDTSYESIVEQMAEQWIGLTRWCYGLVQVFLLKNNGDLEYFEGKN